MKLQDSRLTKSNPKQLQEQPLFWTGRKSCPRTQQVQGLRGVVWTGLERYSPTHHWSPDWCRRRSCRRGSRWGNRLDRPQALRRGRRGRACRPYSSPPRPCSRGRSLPCARLRRRLDTGYHCLSCCGSACSGTPRRSRGSPAGSHRWASSPGGSPCWVCLLRCHLGMTLCATSCTGKSSGCLPDVRTYRVDSSPWLTRTSPRCFSSGSPHSARLSHSSLFGGWEFSVASPPVQSQYHCCCLSMCTPLGLVHPTCRAPCSSSSCLVLPPCPLWKLRCCCVGHQGSTS